MSSLLLLRRAIQQCSSVRLISTRFNSSSVENKNTNESLPSVDPQFKKKIDDFIKSNKVAIFIKGEPDAPRMRKFSFFIIKNFFFQLEVVDFPMLFFKYLIYMGVTLNQKIF
jgi:hypothetical protein